MEKANRFFVSELVYAGFKYFFYLLFAMAV